MPARILEDEIANDPLGRGYSTMNDSTLLASLNAVNRSRNLTTITGREVKANIVDSEYNALTDAKKQQLLTLISVDDLDPFGMAANAVRDIFGAGSTTISNLITARVETISRGQEIGLGVVLEKHLRMHTLSRKVRV